MLSSILLTEMFRERTADNSPSTEAALTVIGWGCFYFRLRGISGRIGVTFIENEQDFSKLSIPSSSLTAMFSAKAK